MDEAIGEGKSNHGLHSICVDDAAGWQWLTLRTYTRKLEHNRYKILVYFKMEPELQRGCRRMEQIWTKHL